MWNCIRQGIEQQMPWLLFVAAIMGILAAIIAGFGGLTIVIATLAIGPIFSAVVAGLIVFGVVVAMGVAAIVTGCLLGARPPSFDEDPAEDPGIQPGDLAGPGVVGWALVNDPDDAASDTGSDRPAAKKPKGPKRGTAANPVGSVGTKKPA
ncbi:MAG: hypothetical protein AB8B82_06980 [Roseovarius sp.]